MMRAMSILSGCLLSVALVGLVGLAHAASASQAEEAAIRDVVAHQARAWNSGDGKAWGSDYAEDADFINILGMIFHGREEIAERHAAIFAGPYKGSHLAIAIRSLKMLAPGVALAETDMDLTGYQFLTVGIEATTPGVLRTHMKYVLVKDGDVWRIVAAQNTAQRPAGHP